MLRNMHHAELLCSGRAPGEARQRQRRQNPAMRPHQIRPGLRGNQEPASHSRVRCLQPRDPANATRKLRLGAGRRGEVQRSERPLQRRLMRGGRRRGAQVPQIVSGQVRGLANPPSPECSGSAARAEGRAGARPFSSSTTCECRTALSGSTQVQISRPPIPSTLFPNTSIRRTQ